MKIIALEEHFGTPIIEETLKAAGIFTPDSNPTLLNQLYDLETERLKDMDAAGIDLQVLSMSGTADIDKLGPEEGTALVRECNNILADMVSSNPNRFASTCHL